MDDSYAQRYDRVLEKLQPDALRASLLRASLFLTAWELLKHDIIDGVEGFFRVGFDGTKWTSGPGYADRVLSLNPNKLTAASSDGPAPPSGRRLHRVVASVLPASRSSRRDRDARHDARGAVSV